MSSRSVTTPPTTRPGGRDLAGRGVAAILVAIVAVAVGRGFAGVVVTIPEVFQPLSWASLVGVATLAGVAAFVGFATLVRFTERPRRWFLALAVAVLAASFVPLTVVGPTVPGATVELLAVVAAMHVAVAVGVTVPILRRPAPPTQVETTSTGG